MTESKLFLERKDVSEMGSICILGRQPALGKAELESLYGTSKIETLGERAAIVHVDPCLLAFDRLGGSIKFCKPLAVLDTTDWQQIEKFLLRVSPDQSERMVKGKMHLGLSAIGFDISAKQLQATALTLKTAIRKTGRSVHVVPNKDPQLSSAQVLHNKLTGPNGWELIFIRDSHKTVVAQTVKVQDIEAYGARDQARPKRDSRVGMLPPKLAQIIINLAVGQLPDEARQSVCEIPPGQPIPRKHFEDIRILDPFCGTGVLLQEARLMGYEVYGADMDSRMGDFYRENMDWLQKKYANLPPYGWQLADATSSTWETSVFSKDYNDAKRVPLDFSIVASETYLGRPFSSPPDEQTLKQVISDVNTIHKKFLQNLARQTKPGFRLCLAVPAWIRSTHRYSLADSRATSSTMASGPDFLHLPVLEKLAELGYTHLSFSHARNEDLIYHRDGQIVGRELIVLQRK